MKYDFTTIMDRKGHDAIAVDILGSGMKNAPDLPKEGFSPITMWIADMNFATYPGITEHIIRRTEHPAFGYYEPSEEYYGAIINWQKMRNGVTGLAKEHIGYENGVLGGMISAVNALCVPGERVLLHSPTYIGFTNSLLEAGYRIVHSPLTVDKDGIWRMDFEDMEKKFRDNLIHTMIFCSPHNPSGRVWSPEEMEEMLALCRKYDVTVISDEIWSDIILDSARNAYMPLQSVSADARERTVALYAPSKTFNLAGLIGSYRIVYNKALREQVHKASRLSHYNHMNVLSMHALIGAYCEGGAEWVDELNQVLSGNARIAYAAVRDSFPGVKAAMPEGTYMIFLDCGEWCLRHGKTADEVMHAGWDVGVAWQDGRPFGGTHTLRINLALPASRVEEAMRRLKEHVFG